MARSSTCQINYYWNGYLCIRRTMGSKLWLLFNRPWRPVSVRTFLLSYYTTVTYIVPNDCLPSTSNQVNRTFSLTAANVSQRTEALPFVLLGYHNAAKAEIGYTATQLVYGTALRLSGEFVDLSSFSNEYEYKLQHEQVYKRNAFSQTCFYSTATNWCFRLTWSTI